MHDQKDDPTTLIVADADPDALSAPSFALLIASTPCWKCSINTPTAALWVPSFIETEDGEDFEEPHAAVFQNILGLDAQSLTFVHETAPWLRLAYTQGSDMEYLAHHCTSCDALQGDHFLFGPDGPYWPQDDAALAAYKVVPGKGPLRIFGAPSFSAWMERVAPLIP